MAQETPTSTSSSGGQAVQLEATNAAEDLKLKDIEDALALDKPRDGRRDDPLALKAVFDPQGQYSTELGPHYDGQNAPLPELIQTGNSTDQVDEINSHVLQFVPEKDHGYVLISHKLEDHLEDCNTNYNIKHKGVDENDQVDGKSSDQNILCLGTKASDKVERATFSKKRLQQNVKFSPTATTPNDIFK